jgi:hypothetical protein
MIVSWKLESGKSLRENNMISSSNSKLDRWITFMILHSFMEIINDLELSPMIISLNKFSIPGDMSGEPQKDILDDDILLLFTVVTIFMTFNDFRAIFVKTVECFQLWLLYMKMARLS